MFRAGYYRKSIAALLLLWVYVSSAVAVSGQTNRSSSDLNDLVDPTAPLQMNSASPQPDRNLFNLISTYRVNSILIRPNMRVAVINSRQVREGDSIGNAEVIRIDKESVTLMVAGEEQVLDLYGRSIKTLNEGDE